MKLIYKHGPYLFLILIIGLLVWGLYYIFSGHGVSQEQQLIEEVQEHQQGTMIQ